MKSAIYIYNFTYIIITIGKDKDFKIQNLNYKNTDKLTKWTVNISYYDRVMVGPLKVGPDYSYW